MSRTTNNRTTLHIRVRRGTACLGIAALASFGLVATGGPAFAVHDLKVELDGDTVADDTSATPATFDWESFFEATPSDSDPTTVDGDIRAKSSALPTNFLARGSTADYALPEYSTFATGSKDTLDIPKWQCGKSNNLGAKDDLVNVYVAAYRNPSNNHLLLYFGAEKSSNLGDNNIAIWFLQDSSVSCTTTGKNTDWKGAHQNGDVLLAAAFTNGGDVADVEYHVWKDGALLGSSDSTTQGHGFTCGSGGESAENAYACAITNDATSQPPNGAIDPPWNHPVKTPAAGTTDSLAPQEFYEGGIDVTQAEINQNITGDPCITTFVADTRSSQSPTATLFDYANGSFPVCKPATTLSVSRSPATIHSGDSVTWTATEQNTGTSPIDQVSVTDTSSPACSPFAPTLQAGETHNIGDLNDNNVLDTGANNQGETWTFTCTQTLTADKTISIYGSGRDTISHKIIAGGPSTSCTFSSTGTVTFQATNYVCDPNERATASVDVIFPSTTLTSTAATVSKSTILKNESVTYTFYEKNDGDVDLTSPSISTDDSNCPNAVQTKKVDDPATSLDESLYNVGDTNNDGILSKGASGAGETWTFTCATSYATAGAKTIHAVGHGTDPLGADVTFYTVSGGADCTAGAIASGKLCDLQERTSLGVTVINPSTNLRESVSMVVTYTYVETNDGDSVITSPYVLSTCGGAAHVAETKKVDNPATTGVNEALYDIGDTNNDGKLDPGESWTFTCSKTVSAPADGTTATDADSSTGHGTDASGATVDNTTDTDEADSSTVTAKNNAPN